jgi:L-lactate dehydrogenase complex protein LldG
LISSSQATQQQSVLERFVDKARLAAAQVSTVADIEAAIGYTLDLCGSRGACRIKVSGCDEPLSDPAEGLCLAKEEKIIAAPMLPAETYDLLCSRSRESGFVCIDSGLRSQLAGVDIGFTFADLGIAETGTIVLNCPGEELRLATMICEYHVCVVPTSRIVADAFDAEEQLLHYMGHGPNYTAFITGPSRTADIERVLAIGVHGPLELHLLLLED